MRYEQGTPAASGLSSQPSAPASQELGIVKKASACITGDLMRCAPVHESRVPVPLVSESLIIFTMQPVMQSERLIWLLGHLLQKMTSSSAGGTGAALAAHVPASYDVGLCCQNLH